MKNPRKWKKWILPWLTLTLTACGQHTPKPPQPSWPIVRVSVNVSSPFLALPLYIAQNLHLFQDEHIRVDIVSANHSELMIADTVKSWPVLGSLASRPDMFLVAPAPDPHFRLRVLDRLPVEYADNLHISIPLLQSIMTLNRTHPYLETVSFRHIQNLWKQRHLPWAIVTLQQFYQLHQQDPHTVILNWLGASTGAIPALTISGHSKDSVQFLRAINLALWYIHTSSPKTIAGILSNPQEKFLPQQIAQGLHYGLWPVTTYISPSEYNRGRALYSLSTKDTWPPYYAGVDKDLATQALSAAY
ncbi:hypothetical protein [Sulfobacillus thermosulfidooxidans]|uniref:hypothetical protein n=1 Tax=Sulfobacillus thermosulfidooxidans TaxID=28034 RepID=UPI0006B4CB31|nr:hypothetical protein [Sulfobacillus thermosulfidooxidans]